VSKEVETMYRESSMRTLIGKPGGQVRARLALGSEHQYVYAEFEGNKNDIIDVLAALGIAVLLLSIACAIFRSP